MGDAFASTGEVQPSLVRSSAKWLIARQLVGLLISASGLIVITRVAGPAQYGVYAAAFNIWFALQALSEINLDVWLVRRRAGGERAAARTAQTMLLVLGLLGSLVCLSVGPLAAAATGIDELALVLALMAPLVMVTTASQAALSQIERAFRFSQVGLVELIGQALFAAVGIGVVVSGWGATGLVLALATQQVFLAVAWILLAGAAGRRMGFNRAFAAEALRFGLPSTTSVAVISIRNNAAQLLVGRLFGAEALGIMNLVYRLLEQAAFLRGAALRLSYALFGRLGQGDKLGSMVERSLVLLLLVGGLPALALAWIAPVLIPAVFGPQWSGAAAFLIWLVPSNLLLGIYLLCNSATAALDRPSRNLVAAIISAAVFLVALVTLAPVLGLAAVAAAELSYVAAITYFSLVLRRDLGSHPFLLASFCWACYSAAALAGFVTPALALAALLPALMPSVRRQIWAEMKAAVRKRHRD